MIRHIVLIIFKLYIGKSILYIVQIMHILFYLCFIPIIVTCLQFYSYKHILHVSCVNDFIGDCCNYFYLQFYTACSCRTIEYYMAFIVIIFCINLGIFRFVQGIFSFNDIKTECLVPNLVKSVMKCKFLYCNKFYINIIIVAFITPQVFYIITICKEFFRIYKANDNMLSDFRKSYKQQK